MAIFFRQSTLISLSSRGLNPKEYKFAVEPNLQNLVQVFKGHFRFVKIIYQNTQGLKKNSSVTIYIHVLFKILPQYQVFVALALIAGTALFHPEVAVLKAELQPVLLVHAPVSTTHLVPSLKI